MGSVKKTRTGGKAKTRKTVKKKADRKAANKATRSASKKGAAKGSRSKKPAAKKARKSDTGSSAGKTSLKKRSMPAPDIEVDAEVLEFIEALERYKHKHNRPFPSWSEVLHVLRSLGYRK